ncbi:MAG TPA: four helix bundle protein [Solirubrobacterales bacterium]|nr:four helix bundle protein [Solirubrobacterales bacterium]
MAVRGSRHRRFLAYQLAASLADEIYGLVGEWSKFELWSVGIQLVRAADSIGANIAEGLGRGTLADQRRLFLIARGSLRETEHWLERASARGMIDAGIHFEPRTTELGRVLTGLIRADPNR